jgi:hypothetical protein
MTYTDRNIGQLDSSRRPNRRAQVVNAWFVCCAQAGIAPAGSDTARTPAGPLTGLVLAPEQGKEGLGVTNFCESAGGLAELNRLLP